MKTIKGKNVYDLENTCTNKTWTFNIINNIELLTNGVVTALENFKDQIYFNNSSGKHWIFDFKVGNVWVEALEIDCSNMTMNIGLF